MLRKKIKFNLNEIYEFIFMNYFYFQNLYERKLLIKDEFFNSKNKKIKIHQLYLKCYQIKMTIIEKYIVNLINFKDLKKYFSIIFSLVYNDLKIYDSAVKHFTFYNYRIIRIFLPPSIHSI